jgi:hypothetical protein
MRYYRCYLLAADGHIAMAEILTCADDSDAARQCRNVFAANRGHAGAEIWDGARQVYRYPEPIAAESDHGDGTDADDDPSARADDCRMTLDADAVRAAHQGDRHFERAAPPMSGSGNSRLDHRR